MPRFNENIEKIQKDLKAIQGEILTCINDENFAARGDDGKLTEDAQTVQTRYNELNNKRQTLEDRAEAIRQHEMSNSGLDSFPVQTAASATAESRGVSEDEATAVQSAIRNVWGNKLIALAQKGDSHQPNIVLLNAMSDGEREALKNHFGANDADPQTLLNVMTSHTAAAGAEMVPTEVAAEISVHEKFHSLIRSRVANVQTRETLRRFSVPRYDDTNKGGFGAEEGKKAVSANRVGGAAAAAYTENGGAGLTSGAPFTPTRLVTDAIPLTQELMDSSVGDFVSLLSEALGERLGRAETFAFTNGLAINNAGITGMMSAPVGFTNPAGKVGPLAAADAMTIQELVSAAQALDPAYQSDAVIQVNPQLIKDFRASQAAAANANRYNYFRTIMDDGQQVTMLNDFIEILGNAAIPAPVAGGNYGVVSSRSRGYRIYDFATANLDVRVFEEFGDFSEGESKIAARKSVAGNYSHAPGGRRVAAAA